MTTFGYDKPLYILPFDHRGSVQTKMFGWEFGTNDDVTAAMARLRDAAYAVRQRV